MPTCRRATSSVAAAVMGSAFPFLDDSWRAWRDRQARVRDVPHVRCTRSETWLDEPLQTMPYPQSPQGTNIDAGPAYIHGCDTKKKKRRRCLAAVSPSTWVASAAPEPGWGPSTRSELGAIADRADLHVESRSRTASPSNCARNLPYHTRPSSSRDIDTRHPLGTYHSSTLPTSDSSASRFASCRFKKSTWSLSCSTMRWFASCAWASVT